MRTDEERGRRTRNLLIVSTLVVSAAALLAWTQDWFTISVAHSADGTSSLDVPGKTAGPATAALGLAGLALGGALSLAGQVLRIIFGAIEAVLGASLVAAVTNTLIDPAGASRQSVTELTGVSGPDAIHRLVLSSSPSFWPFLAAAAGVALVVLGIAVCVTVRTWPQPGHKYDAETAPRTSGVPDAVDSWDELSRGEDPTR